MSGQRWKEILHLLKRETGTILVAQSKETIHDYISVILTEWGFQCDYSRFHERQNKKPSSRASLHSAKDVWERAKQCGARSQKKLVAKILLGIGEIHDERTARERASDRFEQY